MKNLKYIKSISLVILGVLFMACDQDESVPNVPRANSTLAVVTEENITVAEGNDPSFTIVQESLIEPKIDDLELGGFRSGQIGIRVIGGTAVEGEDYNFNILKISDESPFLLQDGYYYDYDASVSLSHVVSGILDIVDDGVAEGSETIILQFFPAGLAAVVINDTITITITD